MFRMLLASGILTLFVVAVVNLTIELWGWADMSTKKSNISLAGAIFVFPTVFVVLWLLIKFLEWS